MPCCSAGVAWCWRGAGVVHVVLLHELYDNIMLLIGSYNQQNTYLFLYKRPFEAQSGRIGLKRAGID